MLGTCLLQSKYLNAKSVSEIFFEEVINTFLDRLNKLGPAQNIFGPRQGQDIRAPITFLGDADESH